MYGSKLQLKFEAREPGSERDHAHGPQHHVSIAEQSCNQRIIVAVRDQLQTRLAFPDVDPALLSPPRSSKNLKLDVHAWNDCKGCEEGERESGRKLPLLQSRPCTVRAHHTTSGCGWGSSWRATGSHEPHIDGSMAWSISLDLLDNGCHKP